MFVALTNLFIYSEKKNFGPCPIFEKKRKKKKKGYKNNMRFLKKKEKKKKGYIYTHCQ